MPPRVGCAPPISKRAQLQELKESRLTVRGKESEVCRIFEGLDKTHCIVPLPCKYECNASGNACTRV